MAKNKKIYFSTTEIVPFAHVSSLAPFSTAIPTLLQELGHDIRTITNSENVSYRSINEFDEDLYKQHILNFIDINGWGREQIMLISPTNGNLDYETNLPCRDSDIGSVAHNNNILQDKYNPRMTIFEARERRRRQNLHTVPDNQLKGIPIEYKKGRKPIKTLFRVGDTIILTINNYDGDGGFIEYNGDMGRIIAFINLPNMKEPEIVIRYDKAPNKDITYNFKDFKSMFKRAYSLTTHKMQGSQSPIVIYIMNVSSFSWNFRNKQRKSQLYTGCSRARDGCHIISIGDANNRNGSVIKYANCKEYECYTKLFETLENDDLYLEEPPSMVINFDDDSDDDSDDY